MSEKYDHSRYDIADSLIASDKLEYDRDRTVTWPRLILYMAISLAVGCAAGWVLSRLMCIAHGLPAGWGQVL